MRWSAMACVVLGLTISVTFQAAAHPSAGDESFEALKKEYDFANNKFREEIAKEAEAKIRAYEKERAAAEKAVKDANTVEEKRIAEKRLQGASSFPALKAISPADGPGERFAPRFLAFAVKNPKDRAALDALYMAMLTGGDPTRAVGSWDGTIKALQSHHVANTELKRALRLLRATASAGVFDERANQWLRDVMEKNPDRRAQARSCQALAQGRTRAAEFGEQLRNDPRFRSGVEATLGRMANVERLIEGVATAKNEAMRLNRLLREKYNDVCPDLSIGKSAPEVVSNTLDNKTVQLSSLKGKVLVLDIWATWCAPCRAMIPHEREMVDRLKDKPFALVSISVDEKKESLANFLAKEPMPWTQWWNGSEGGVIEDWNVEAYPTIYVIDAKGVIRFKDLRGEKLEQAVNELLKEVESN